MKLYRTFRGNSRLFHIFNETKHVVNIFLNDLITELKKLNVPTERLILKSLDLENI